MNACGHTTLPTTEQNKILIHNNVSKYKMAVFIERTNSQLLKTPPSMLKELNLLLKRRINSIGISYIQF